MTSAMIFQIQSFLIFSLMCFGVFKRKNRNLHVKIMGASIIWDILLILQIELSRGAIAKASKVMTNPMLLKVHLFFAIGSVLLYFFMIFSGRKILAGETNMRGRHRICGWTTLFFRLMTFVTSFWAAS